MFRLASVFLAYIFGLTIFFSKKAVVCGLICVFRCVYFVLCVRKKKNPKWRQPHNENKERLFSTHSNLLHFLKTEEFDQNFSFVKFFDGLILLPSKYQSKIILYPNSNLYVVQAFWLGKAKVLPQLNNLNLTLVLVLTVSLRMMRTRKSMKNQCQWGQELSGTLHSLIHLFVIIIWGSIFINILILFSKGYLAL